MANQKIYIFALAAHGKGISGSDRIFNEFARRWAKLFSVIIYVWEEGAQMLKRQHLVKQISIKNNLQIKILKIRIWCKFGFLVCYLARIIRGIIEAFRLTINHQSSIIVYSASEFWMDSLPAFTLKLRFSKITWAAAWYQTAPKPWTGFRGYNKYFLSALIYWLMQLPIKPLIDNFADFVLVNNDYEKKVFPKLNQKGKAIVVLGAVDLQNIKLFTKHFPLNPKKYDAVFQGRFHPQKGVLELVDIWRLVLEKKPDAKLVMIGDGPLMKKIKIKIKDLNMEKNIILVGYLFDGEEKYRIFAQSKVVVHPSFYDSGGMAALEAMAFGLPGVGFNLSSYRYYYPKGMIKVRAGNKEDFANQILKLLSNKKFYIKIKDEVKNLISDKFSWDYRSRQILSQVLE